MAVLLHLFGSYFVSKSVVIWCDNQCTVGAIRKFAIGKSNAKVMASIMRCIFSLCIQYVCLRPKWIEGSRNVLADALSRQQWAVAQQELLVYIRRKGYPGSRWLERNGLIL